MVIHVKHPNLWAWVWLLMSFGLTVFVGLYAWQVRHDHLEQYERVALLQRALDEAPVGIAMADLTTGIATYRNERLIAMTGATVQDVNETGGPTTQYGDAAQWQRLSKLASANQVFDDIITMRRASGDEVRLRLIAFPVRERPAVIIGFFLEGNYELASRK